MARRGKDKLPSVKCRYYAQISYFAQWTYRQNTAKQAHLHEGCCTRLLKEVAEKESCMPFISNTYVKFNLSVEKCICARNALHRYSCPPRRLSKRPPGRL
jgi:hypothetical protein